MYVTLGSKMKGNRGDKVTLLFVKGQDRSSDRRNIYEGKI